MYPFVNRDSGSTYRQYISQAQHRDLHQRMPTTAPCVHTLYKLYLFLSEQLWTFCPGT